jgi:hypothetical protein
MNKKVTTLSVQTDTTGKAFRLVFITDDGAGVPVVLTPDMLRDTIAALIEAGSVVPHNHQPQLTAEVTTAPNPINVSGLDISPMLDEPSAARLTLLCGMMDLQFSIPVSELFQALEALKATTEPDPTPLN